MTELLARRRVRFVGYKKIGVLNAYKDGVAACLSLYVGRFAIISNNKKRARRRASNVLAQSWRSRVVDFC